MTLIYELHLDILKTFLRTKNTVSCQGFQTLEHEQDTHTDTHTDAIERIRVGHWPGSPMGWFGSD